MPWAYPLSLNKLPFHFLSETLSVKGILAYTPPSCELFLSTMSLEIPPRKWVSELNMMQQTEGLLYCVFCFHLAWLKNNLVTSYCPEWWWHMCPWQGIPAPLTDVTRHTNDIQIAAKVQSFQKTTHFSTELHRKLLGKRLNPLFSSCENYCVRNTSAWHWVTDNCLPSSNPTTLYWGQLVWPLSNVSIHLLFSENCFWIISCFSALYIRTSLFSCSVLLYTSCFPRLYIIWLWTPQKLSHCSEWNCPLGLSRAQQSEISMVRCKLRVLSETELQCMYMCHCYEGQEWNMNMLSAQAPRRDCCATEDKGYSSFRHPSVSRTAPSWAHFRNPTQRLYIVLLTLQSHALDGSGKISHTLNPRILVAGLFFGSVSKSSC